MAKLRGSPCDSEECEGLGFASYVIKKRDTEIEALLDIIVRCEDYLVHKDGCYTSDTSWGCTCGLTKVKLMIKALEEK